MGRKGSQKAAWVYSGGTGVRIDRGRALPGFHAGYYEYMADGRKVRRSESFDTLKACEDFAKAINEQFQFTGLRERVGRYNPDLAAPVVAAKPSEGVGPLKAVETGRASKRRRPRISEASLKFYNTLICQSEYTQRQYARDISRLVESAGDIYIDEVTAEHIDQLVKERKSDKVAIPTIRKMCAGLMAFFNFLIDYDYLDCRNPVQKSHGRPASKQYRRNRPAVNNDLLDEIIAACDTADRKLACQIAATSGLDRNVIIQLCAAMIDWDEGGVKFYRPKTDIRLLVPLHPQILTALDERRRDGRSATTPLLTGIGVESRYDPKRWKACRDEGKPKNRSKGSCKQDWWHEVREKVGMPKMYFRDLRAVASQRAQRDAGLSLADTASLLGHSTVTVTAGHYTPIDPNMKAVLAKLPLPGSRKKAG